MMRPLYRGFPLIALLCISACTGADRWFAPAENLTRTVKLTEGQQWWRQFDDPLMNDLTEQLWAENLELQIAQTRIDEARGLLRQQRGGWFPSVDATGSASRANDGFGQVKPASILQGGFDASWELDAFGRMSAGVDAAQARLVAREATALEVQQSVLAELLSSIVRWRQAQERTEVSKALSGTQREEVRLLEVRHKAGLTDASALARARAQLLEISAEIPVAQARMRQAQAQMERLLGLKDGALTERLKATSRHTIAIPRPAQIQQISLESVAERPDMRAARAELLAAQADLKAAEAALWPRISLSGFFGARDVSVALPLADNPIWSLASSITVPLLNFGTLRGAVDTSNARAHSAMLQYENTAQRAVEETRIALEDALGRIEAAQVQQRSLQDRKDAVVLATERNRSGLKDMTEVTTAQAELDRASLLSIDHSVEAALAYVRLQKSLGLGFQKSPKLGNISVNN